MAVSEHFETNHLIKKKAQNNQKREIVKNAQKRSTIQRYKIKRSTVFIVFKFEKDRNIIIYRLIDYLLWRE